MLTIDIFTVVVVAGSGNDGLGEAERLPHHSYSGARLATPPATHCAKIESCLRRIA